MTTQPITTVLEVEPGDWRQLDAGSVAQWQNVITSQKELTQAIDDAIATCIELCRKVEAEVQP